jgi:hypothetical protein
VRLRILGDEPANGWNGNTNLNDESCRSHATVSPPRDLTHSFQRLASFDNGVFERLGRYETALRRQVAQILFVLVDQTPLNHQAHAAVQIRTAQTVYLPQ